MTTPTATSELLATAVEDHQSVIDLTRQLVAVPSRGGIDPYDPVLDLLTDWLEHRHLEPRRLHGPAGEPVGLACEIDTGRPGPRWVLNACLDTAPFGDETAWRHPPTSATIQDNWLHGRGSADSKAGAAIFAHLLARLAQDTSGLHGQVVLLCDVDEHTGNFGGAKAYFTDPTPSPAVAGVMIGYPGIEDLIVGSRGVYRARIEVHGIAAHSGAGRAGGTNAITKAAELVAALADHHPEGPTATFPQPSKVTVTAVHGGEGYSTVPDLCEVLVDVRTTPSLAAADAHRILAAAVDTIDNNWPDTPPSDLHLERSWPAYTLGPDDPMRAALIAAGAALGAAINPKISGPSNIGNYLATLGIPATAGWGVRYEGLHATDERIELATIPLVQAVYHHAVLALADAHR